MCSDATVLYIDFQGHPAPLSRCFHATASRHLSSSVERNPPTTKTQVDSAYCPQSLTVHDVTSATSMGGKSATCKQCPMCQAVVSLVVVDSMEAFYKCGYCDWNSRACGITTTVTLGKDEIIGKEEMSKASEALVDILAVKTSGAEAEAHTRYQDLLKAWEAHVKPTHHVSTATLKLSPHETWSLEALEESLVSKQQQMKTNEEEWIGNSNKVAIDADKPLMLDSSLQDMSCESLLLQSNISCSLLPTSKDSQLPLPMPLRVRKSRRDLLELKSGKPGILVKPKLNPLDGDSSLRSGHGQWWKKDSTALHDIPKLTVEKYDGETSFLLKVSNPTMSTVKLQLGPSNYTGEREGSNIMKHVLMDSLETNYKTIKVLEGIDTTTPLVELEAVQDSLFMERQPTLPNEVVEWKGNSGSSDATATPASIRHLASQKDVAWFQLDMETQSTAQPDKMTWLAIPISLQIQVGDGSWESSLIQPIQQQGDEPDLVAFDVLIAFDPNAGK